MEIATEKVLNAVLPKHKMSSFLLFRYPATLSITVKGYEPDLKRSMSFSRPMSVLEEELTGDICTNASAEPTVTATDSQPLRRKLNHKQDELEIDAPLKMIPRLPGQVR